MRNGFTLIELLVAISIISILSSIGYISYSSAQVKAKDVKRKQDLRSIKTALELYKFRSTSKSYPTTDGACCSDGANLSSSDQKPWIPGLSSSFINSVPKDPLKDEGNPISSNSNILGYSYWAGSISGGGCPGGSGQYFILASGLENKYDPESNLNKEYTSCAGSAITERDNVFILTSQ